MDDIVKGFYNLAQKIPYAEEKALAYYLVREILEDLHSNGKISEKEMLAINKTAVNRAHEYIMATKNEAAHKAFIMIRVSLFWVMEQNMLMIHLLKLLFIHNIRHVF